MPEVVVIDALVILTGKACMLGPSMHAELGNPDEELSAATFADGAMHTTLNAHASRDYELTAP